MAENDGVVDGGAAGDASAAQGGPDAKASAAPDEMMNAMREVAGLPIPADATPPDAPAPGPAPDATDAAEAGEAAAALAAAEATAADAAAAPKPDERLGALELPEKIPFRRSDGVVLDVPREAVATILEHLDQLKSLHELHRLAQSDPAKAAEEFRRKVGAPVPAAAAGSRPSYTADDLDVQKVAEAEYARLVQEDGWDPATDKVPASIRTLANTNAAVLVGQRRQEVAAAEAAWQAEQSKAQRAMDERIRECGAAVGEVGSGKLGIPANDTEFRNLMTEFTVLGNLAGASPRQAAERFVRTVEIAMNKALSARAIAAQKNRETHKPLTGQQRRESAPSAPNRPFPTDPGAGLRRAEQIVIEAIHGGKH